MTIEEAKELYKSGDPASKQRALQYFSESKLTLGYLPKSWEELKHFFSGHWISESSEIMSSFQISTDIQNKNCFVTTEQAKSALAFAQLSQLAHAINGIWKPNYETHDYGFSVMCCNKEGLYVLANSVKPKVHVVFKTKELAEFSLKNHKELWEKYWINA